MILFYVTVRAHGTNRTTATHTRVQRCRVGLSYYLGSPDYRNPGPTTRLGWWTATSALTLPGCASDDSLRLMTAHCTTSSTALAARPWPLPRNMLQVLPLCFRAARPPRGHCQCQWPARAPHDACAQLLSSLMSTGTTRSGTSRLLSRRRELNARSCLSRARALCTIRAVPLLS